MQEPLEQSGNDAGFEPYWYGRYLLMERIGVGGMAEVYRAQSFGAEGFVKEVAIKKLLTRLLDDQEFVDMFVDEAKLMAALGHANVVQVFDLGNVHGHYYIAMEYVNGRDLLDLLAHSSRARRRIPVEVALYVVIEMLSGLHFTHNACGPSGEPLKIVHRDVSPSNIMLTYAGDVKVGDFGIAKSVIQSRSTQAGVQKGKLGYMSPEQVTGGLIDRRSDVFAAGVILFEVLTMTRLFKAKNDLDVMLKIRDVRVDAEFDRVKERLDDEIRAIINKALARKQSERYQSGDELRDALIDYCYDKGLKPSAKALAAYMHEIFDTEIREMKERRRGDPQILASMQPVYVKTLPVYRYRDPAGVIHGPMALEQISELMATRAEDDLERVSVEDGPWCHVDEITELRPTPRLLDASPTTDPKIIAPWDDGQKDTPPPTKTHAAPALRGQIGRVSFARLLYRMYVKRVTGKLYIRRGDLWKKLYFVNGIPGVVESNIEDEYLGRVLVRQGALDEATLDKALDQVRQSESRLGDVLVGSGTIAPAELFQCLNDQLDLKLSNLFHWPQADWEWYPHERAGERVVSLVVDIGSLMIRAVNTMKREFIHGFYLMHRNPKLVRVADRPSAQNIPIPARALRATHLIASGDSVQTAIEHLFGSGRWTEEEAYRVLFLLTELEVFVFENERPAPFPAAEWA